ncbi:MAG: sigma-70 family RNA polymerase sigma factor [Syntrophales bacterium LBB04]|nr:sigma-70 family RNA polymerase sigma factor [Syntrophales bacterium LBB04]
MNSNDSNYRRIHDDFQPRILRYMTRLVGENEAEDLTQEVLVKIGQSLNSFRGESQLSTWIYQIATNIALDRLRRAKIQRRVDTGLPLEVCEDRQEDQDIWTSQEKVSLDQQIIRWEMNGCIREIIDTLPGDYRSVIVLSELEGLTDRKISEVLGITPETVKIRLHRARARLKKELSAACVFFRDERNEFACDRRKLQVRIEKNPSAGS